MGVEMAKEWLESGSGPAHPNHEIIVVKNEGDKPASWAADGRPVEIDPGECQRLPRWVFHLGLNYPGHQLVECEDGSEEYERQKQAKLRREIEAKREELKAQQKALADMQAAYKRGQSSTGKEGEGDQKPD